jgi:hypothetical protein
VVARAPVYVNEERKQQIASRTASAIMLDDDLDSVMTRVSTVIASRT